MRYPLFQILTCHPATGVVEQFGGVPAFGLADHDFVTVLARSSTDTAVDAECLA